MELTTHLHPVPVLRISGAIPPLPHFPGGKAAGAWRLPPTPSSAVGIAILVAHLSAYLACKGTPLPVLTPFPFLPSWNATGELCLTLRYDRENNREL